MAIKKFDELDQMLMRDFKGEGVVCPKNVSKSNVDLDLVAFEYLLTRMEVSENIAEEGLNKNVEEIKKLEKESFFSDDEKETFNYAVKSSGSPIKFIDKIRLSSPLESSDSLAYTVNTGLSNIVVYSDVVEKNRDALKNYIWAEITIQCEEDEESDNTNYVISELNRLSIQSFDEVKNSFAKVWQNYNLNDKVDILLRSIGVEPDLLELKEEYKNEVENSLFRAKMHLITRLIPFVENNYNLMEIGQKGTGKSYLQKLSLNSTSHSVSNVTYADLFGDKRYKENTAEVGKNDVIFIDEISKGDFKEKTLIEKMNTYLTDGFYNVGSKGKKEKIPAKTSFVFTGNNNKDVQVLLRRDKYNLFTPCPGSIEHDETVQDRINFYIPSWEFEEFPNSIKTKHLGLSLDFLFKLFHSLREDDYTNTLKEKGFGPNGKITNRDKKSINKTVSGLIKLLNISDEKIDTRDLEKYLAIAIEGRNRVIMQKKSISSFEEESISFISPNKNKCIDRINGNNNPVLERIPLEIIIMNQKVEEFELKSHEVSLINEQEMNEFNIRLFRNLLNTMNNREEKIIAVNKEFFDSNVFNYNFELVINKNTNSIEVNIYSGNCDPTPSVGIGQLLDTIANKINLEVNEQVLDSYVKTYTIIRDKLIKLRNQFPDIQSRLRLPTRRFTRLTSRDFNRLDFNSSINNEIKPSIFYSYDNKNNDGLVCEYGGIDTIIKWHLNDQNSLEIYYSLNRNILDYI